ncbi:MAG TPA: hypothetical protein DCQ31_07605 [Bacteroidales bacterium]|nr:hypothetical protein [Bacteroidales bacterium]
MQVPEVFVSYAWGGESERFVNKLYAFLKAENFDVLLDKIDLGYKGNIKSFMQQLGQGRAIVVVISDKYLKSANCMFEMVEIAKHNNFSERIFPIIFPDANMYNPNARTAYIIYWENEVKKLNESMKNVENMALIAEIQQELVEYNEILNAVSKITSILKNTNSLTPEMHEHENFKSLLEAVSLVLPKKKNEDAGESRQVEKDEPTTDPVNRKYKLANIQKLLLNTFSDTDLNSFCMIYFEEVYQTFADGQSKQQKVLKLLDYCKRFMKFEYLLFHLEEENSAQFSAFQSYW